MPGVKRLISEADRSSPSSAEVKTVELNFQFPNAFIPQKTSTYTPRQPKNELNVFFRSCDHAS
jgi:hypothetical protein